MAVIVGARSGVVDGGPAFDLMSNACDYFELGQSAGVDVWLEGKIVDGDDGPEYIFNGRLFCADGGHATIIDNFPKSDPPAGWRREQSLDGSGFVLKDAQGEVVFSYSIRSQTCYVTLGVHRADGLAAAFPGQGGLVTQGIPIKIGRGGIVIA